MKKTLTYMLAACLIIGASSPALAMTQKVVNPATQPVSASDASTWRAWYEGVL